MSEFRACDNRSAKVMYPGRAWGNAGVFQQFDQGRSRELLNQPWSQSSELPSPLVLQQFLKDFTQFCQHPNWAPTKPQHLQIPKYSLTPESPILHLSLYIHRALYPNPPRHLSPNLQQPSCVQLPNNSEPWNRDTRGAAELITALNRDSLTIKRNC